MEKINKYRKEIFGISTIGIVLLHINKYVALLPGTTTAGKLLSIIFENGNIGVDIFLLMSAIGLTYSFEHNSIGIFYANRIKRVFIPFFIFAIVYFFWFDFCYVKDGCLNYILNITSVNYWLQGDKFPLWYVSFILIIYLLFPGIYYINCKNKLYTVAANIAVIAIEFFLFKTKSPVYSEYEIVLSRIPVFLAGVLICKIKPSVSRLKFWLIIISGFAAGGGYILL